MLRFWTSNFKLSKLETITVIKGEAYDVPEEEETLEDLEEEEEVK